MPLVARSHSVTPHLRSAPLILTICVLAHCSTAAHGKPELLNRDIAALAVNEYRKESDTFFASTPNKSSVNEFYRSWRDRLVAAAEAPGSPASQIAALGEAIRISNFLKDYVYSIDLIQELLNLDPPEAFSTIWSTELGEVSRLEWDKSQNKTHGRLAVATFRRLLEGDVAIDDNTRLLVSGWLADMASPAIMTKEDFAAAATHAEAAVQTLKQGHEPGGRLVGTGFDQRWFLEYLLRLYIQSDAYNDAFDALRKYDALAGTPLSAAGIVVDIENSNRRLSLDSDSAVDAYVAFLDRSADSLDKDPYGVTLRLIAARRFYQHDNYDEAAPRLEALLTTYRAAINASQYSDYHLSEILTMLRDIYNKNGLTKKAKEVAEQAIEIKQRANLPIANDEAVLRRLEAQDAFSRNIADNADGRGLRWRLWFIIINIALVVFFLVAIVLRKSRGPAM